VELEKLGELTGDKSRECLSDLPTEGIKDADLAEYVQELHSILGEACSCSLAGVPGFIANVGLAPIEVETERTRCRLACSFGIFMPTRILSGAGGRLKSVILQRSEHPS
jgi:hypothetical protein